MKQRLVLLLLFGLYFFINLKASHIKGIEITYTQIGPKLYELNLKMYRDCSGVPLCQTCQTSSCGMNVSVTAGNLPVGLNHNIKPSKCNSGYLLTQILNLDLSKPIYEVNELYGVPTTVCNLCQNRTPGTFSPGAEAYHFKGNLNLSSISDSCCWVKVVMSILGRNLSVTNLQNVSDASYVVESHINLCESGPNNSPKFSKEPILISCINNDYFYKIDATDSDGDSLSYRLGTSYRLINNPVVYHPPFSREAPIPYLGFPSTNPNFQPPFGLKIDAVTGLIQYRPQSAFNSALPIDVLKWRKINGVPTLMGIVTREVDHTAISCFGSIPSVAIYNMQGDIIPANEIRICESKEPCVIIAAKDGFTTGDTTFLEFAQTPNMSIFPFYNPATRRTQGPIHDSVKVCMNYQPNTNPVSQVFALSIFARDRTLPINMSSQKSFRVIIMAEPKVRLLATSTGNMGRKIYLGRLNTVPFNAALTNWNIENFPGSNSFSAFNAKDTVSFTFSGGGWYKVNYELTADCGKISIQDSLFIGGFSIFAFQNQAQICGGDSTASIAASAAGAIGNPRFRINNDSFQNQAVFTGLPSGSYKIYGKDEANNLDSVVVVIPVKQALQLNISKINSRCGRDSTGSITLSALGGQPSYKYIAGGDTNSTGSFIKLPGGLIPVRLIDQTGCIKDDTVNLFNAPLLRVSLNIQGDQCTSQPSGLAVASISGGSLPYKLSWLNNIPSSQTFYGGLLAGTYPLKITDAQDCVLDTFFSIPLAPVAYNAANICAVDVINPLEKKQVIRFNKIAGNRISVYQIWETIDTLESFILKQTISANQAAIFYDTLQVSENTKKYYRLMALDSCGRISFDERMASPMNISINNYVDLIGVFPTYTLRNFPRITWKAPLLTNSILQYKIYRKGNAGVFVLVQTVAATVNSFIDSTFRGNGQILQYYVEAVLANVCGQNTLKSHAASYAVLAVSENAALAKEFKIFPNPASTVLNIKSINNKAFKEVKILSLEGKLLQYYGFEKSETEAQINLPLLAKGMYFVSLELEDKQTVSLPIIIE